VARTGDVTKEVAVTSVGIGDCSPIRLAGSHGLTGRQPGPSSPGAPSLSASVAPRALAKRALGRTDGKGAQGLAPRDLEPEVEGAGRAFFTHTTS